MLAMLVVEGCIESAALALPGLLVRLRLLLAPPRLSSREQHVCAFSTVRVWGVLFHWCFQRIAVCSTLL